MSLFFYCYVPNSTSSYYEVVLHVPKKKKAQIFGTDPPNQALEAGLRMILLVLSPPCYWTLLGIVSFRYSDVCNNFTEK
jgi:hypothetical protein